MLRAGMRSSCPVQTLEIRASTRVKTVLLPSMMTSTSGRRLTCLQAETHEADQTVNLHGNKFEKGIRRDHRYRSFHEPEIED